MPPKNLRKLSKKEEKESVGSDIYSTSEFPKGKATSASNEARATGPADPMDMVTGAAAAELESPNSTAAMTHILKEAMATFQAMLDNAVKSVVESIEKVERALEFEGQRIDDLEKKNKDLEGRMEKMEKAYNQLQQKVMHQEAEVNKAERFSRRNNCRLVGIPEPTGDQEEDCIKIVEDIFKSKFKCDVKVERAHRDGKKGVRPRHIIFKMLSYRDKVNIMKNTRKALHSESYYLTEDMTKRDLEAKKKHSKEVQDLYNQGTKLRFYAGQ